MILKDTQVIQKLKEKRSQELIDCELHESRLTFHTKSSDNSYQSKTNKRSAFEDFIESYPDKILPNDKAETFKNLISWPIPTVGLVSKAFKELSKVHDGQNKVIEFFFKDEELEQDFNEYREKIQERRFWNNDGWNVVRHRINSVLAIDLSIEQEGRPAPEMFLIGIESVHEIMNNINGVCEYLIWKSKPTQKERDEKIIDIAFIYDDERYRKAILKDGDEQFTIIVDAPHDLGYCPAKQFWNEKLDNSLVKKKAPHSEEVGNLDWLLFQTITERHLGLYAGFPIITSYQEECNYKSEDGFECDSGWVNRVLPPLHEGGEARIHSEQCPDCESRKLIGAGSIKEVPAPQDKEEHTLMPAVEITEGDTDSLKWYEGSIEVKRNRFLDSVIGSGGEPNNDQAQNEKQVTGSFESKQQVLLDLARNYETITKFALDTIGLLRYGKEQYQGSAVSYGTKFFLQTEEQLLKDYDQAKKDGLPNYMLELSRESLLQKKFKNDPVMMARVSLLDLLEPYPDYSIDQLAKLDYVQREKKALKVYFNDYIKRFEIEYGDIVKWMKDAPLEIKITKINDILEAYLKEDIPDEPVEVPPVGGGSPKPNFAK